MPPCGGHVTEREQDECTIGKPWVRQGQAGCVDHEISHGQQVEIERAGSIRQVANSACFGFDGVENGEQLRGSEQP